MADAPDTSVLEDAPEHAGELGANFAGAIYGLILVTSVIAVYRQETSVGPGTVAVTVIVTSLVFWLAHVYAQLLAFNIEQRRPPRWAEVRAAMVREWPIVSAAFVPVIPLLLGTFEVFGGRYAVGIALIVCLVELAVTGVESARRGGATGPVLWISGGLALAFGLVVVGLKILVH